MCDRGCGNGVGSDVDGLRLLIAGEGVTESVGIGGEVLRGRVAGWGP